MAHVPIGTVSGRRLRQISPVAEQGEVLRSLDAGFDIYEDPAYSDLVHAHPRSAEPFQRWFRYREGFAPELITRAMNSLSIPCNRVLDPFCGAGSTLLAASHAGVESIGFDVNPIVALVARSKTHSYSPSDLVDIRVALSQMNGIAAGMPQSPRPGLSILDKVFRPDVLDALLASRYVIDQLPGGRARDFLMTGWLAILEGVSNTFKEGNGIKYRNRRRTPTGYVLIPWESVPGYTEDGWNLVRHRLARQFEAMLADIEPGAAHPTPTILEESSISGIEAVAPRSISLCIFSPPYCNNFNYMKIFKLELWMSGLVSSYGEIRAISQKALRSHVEMRIEEPTDAQLPAELRTLVQMIDRTRLWNAKIPPTVLAYFADMQELLSGVFQALQPGGECHIVVGNSAYGGVIIPTDSLVARIGETLGFSVQRVLVARHLTTSSQQRRPLQDLLGFLRESVVILKKG